ncbi:MAG: hypothetical protein JNK87_37800 [Bryobacterales bacterium]|nr:hypothetical protein [Bryobacterales bacterium]
MIRKAGSFIVLLALLGGAALLLSHRLQFITGGALINLGYRMQDRLEAYDFKHAHASPDEVWNEFHEQNRLASLVRTTFPRSSRHPLVALVTCMDARLDTNEIAGDTRRYYYVLRMAGSALDEKDEDMLELAVNNGVEVVVFTTHTDCAAEKMAKNAEQRKQYPYLAKAVDERQARFEEFMKRPGIESKINEHKLLVKWVDLDTSNERAIVHH